MPDLKISQLPVASTPLAGTELVPIVQGGITEQTTVQAIMTSAVPSGTANGVLYLNGSKVATSGSALTFDGTRLTVNSGATSEALRLNATADTYLSFQRSGVGTAYVQSTSGGMYVWNQENTAIQFGVNNVEQMRLTSTGLGIGTSSPGVKLDVVGSGQTISRVKGGTGTNQGSAFYVTQAGSSNTLSAFGDRAAIQGGTPDQAVSIFTFTGLPLLFDISGSERMRLDTSGNLGLGGTPSAWASYFSAIQAGNATKGGAFVAAGGFSAYGHNYYEDSAGVSRYVNSTYALAYKTQGNGNHAWYTAPSGTAGNAISFSQVMTLDASGNLGVGVTGPAVYTVGSRLLQIDGGANATELKLTNNTTGNAGGDGTLLQLNGLAAYFWNLENSFLSFGTNNTERARITSSGDWLLGNTGGVSASQAGIRSGGSGFIEISRGSGTTSWDNISFINGNGTVGTITTSGTSTSYVTSSDYRLKNITGPITTSGAYIDSLNPVEGTWKADGSTFVGLIAHEVQEASRTQVATGTKDGEQMQAMDYSNAELIANLIAEVKSLRARVAALESQP